MIKVKIALFLGLLSSVSQAAICKPELCVVAPPARERDRYQDQRTCLPQDTHSYRELIDRALASFPEPAQKQFCAFKKVYIEQDFMGSAWSAPIDEAHPNEILLGLRQADLDSGVSLETYLSWFQQQSFGGPKNFKTDPALPRIQVTPQAIADLPAVAYTLLHEIGHSFDYQRDEQKSWKPLSKDFSEKKSICLNRCTDRFLDPRAAAAFYDSLFQAGFLSQLSALNPMEDFAESFALDTLTHKMGADVILSANGRSFSIRKEIESNPFKAKRRYLKSSF